jgi:GH25 family lysozyme M1 (1,4-beta-N-acetylmuramidase)
MWKTNVEACVKYNIPFGVYLYSYANTEEKAASEAQHVLRLIDGYYPQLPIFYDMEDKIQAALTNEERGKIAEIFCDAISNAGYEVGIYANKNWWSNYLTDSAFDNQSWYRWVAQYNSSCTYSGNYVMWQYSDAGSLDGVGTKLDVNFWYGDVITAN